MIIEREEAKAKYLELFGEEVPKGMRTNAIVEAIENFEDLDQGNTDEFLTGEEFEELTVEPVLKKEEPEEKPEITPSLKKGKRPSMNQHLIIVANQNKHWPVGTELWWTENQIKVMATYFKKEILQFPENTQFDGVETIGKCLDCG